MENNTYSKDESRSDSCASPCSAVKVGFNAPGMTVGFECSPGVAARLCREILRAVLESQLDGSCADACPKCGGKETISDETGVLCASCMELFLPPNGRSDLSPAKLDAANINDPKAGD